MTVTTARRVVREGLERRAGFTLERTTAGGDATDGLTLEGHAAVFGQRTLIDSWEGRFLEEVAPGAFKKTFRERTPVLQFDHGRHPVVGSIPIGRIKELREDDLGAYVRARLSDNWLVQPVRDAIAEESIDGMSFRFSVVREEWRNAEGKLIRDDEELLRLLWSDSTEEPIRTLRELRVPELGPVVFPAYDGTSVGVRSGTATIDLAQLRDDPEARKSLGRALWLAESGSVGADSSDGDAPQQQQHPDPEERDAPQADLHPSNDTSEDRTDASAQHERMRARLDSLNSRR